MKANCAEEYAAYRFHRKLRLMARKAFFYNMAYGNYLYAFVYHFFWTFEIIATEVHKRRLKSWGWQFPQTQPGD